MKRLLAACTIALLWLPTSSVADEPLGGPAFFTSKVSDSQVKIYAKDIVGVGKVSFVVDGKEIAWVRAQNNEDKKLRLVGETPYLVRTVDLEPGKNRIEILVEGRRAWRVTYSGS